VEITQDANSSFQQPPETPYVLHRRFDRMGRLIGDEAMEKLFRSHVLILGLGGVGSWAAESLARSGVGHLTIADFDEVCITNANRQLHAVQGMVGRKKAEVMGERLRKINPQARIDIIPEFYNADSSEKFFAVQPDFIVDAIDNLTAKAHLLGACRDRGFKVITSSGAAARLDPLQVKLVDLGETHTDPMAQQLRKILRQRYDFPEGRRFGIPCVFSEEEPMLPVELHYDKGQGFKCVCPQNADKPHSCEHRNVIYGTASFVTGTFGLTMASWVVKEIIGVQK
jgi:tRNA A37 threonylcarbamoyladenosine dehydratase